MLYDAKLISAQVILLDPPLLPGNSVIDKASECRQPRSLWFWPWEGCAKRPALVTRTGAWSLFMSYLNDTLKVHAHTHAQTHSLLCAHFSDSSLRCCEVWADQEVTSWLPHDSQRSKVRGISPTLGINGASVGALIVCHKTQTHTDTHTHPTLTQLP